MQEVQEYIDWKSVNAPRAAESYAPHLRKFFAQCEKTPEEVTLADIVAHAKRIQKKHAQTTVSYFLTIMKNFVKYQRLQGRGGVHPDLIKIPRARANSHRPVTREEVTRMLSIFDGDRSFVGLRDGCILRLLWDTGMRVSELCALNWDDLDIQRNSAIIQNKKNTRSRVVVWSDETGHHLKNYVGVRIAMNGTKPLFVGLYQGNIPSQRITTRTVQRIIRQTAKKAGIPYPVTPHCFRHGWAVHRREHGAQLVFIQKGLGHSNPASTFVYEQYHDPDFMATARKMLEVDAA